jgi:hypothetical protein
VIAHGNCQRFKILGFHREYVARASREPEEPVPQRRQECVGRPQLVDVRLWHETELLSGIERLEG